MSGTALSGSALTALVVAVVLVIIIIAIFLYLARRLRSRRDQLLGDLKAKPELVQDRAFNRLAMARREAEVLARTGADIHAAQGLIAQSQSAFDLRDYPRSYELAQSAHESLVNARGRAGPPLPATHAAGPTPGSSPLRTGGPSPPPTPLPKNRAESHFMLGLLVQDLEKAPPGAGPTLEGQALRGQSQAAFDRGDYAESFRLALRGRRALGGPLETLAPSSRSAAPPAGAGGRDPDAAANSMAGAQRCSECGYPTLPGDGFCRGCGRSLVPATCPACGAARTTADSFCGKCGAPFPA